MSKQKPTSPSTATASRKLPKPTAAAKAAGDAPSLTPELIERLRAADSVETGVLILAPTARPKTKPNATYRLNPACTEPLPQRRGACLRVITVAVRLDRPFKVEDIATALPDVKSAPYWTRRLAKTGHLHEVTE